MAIIWMDGPDHYGSTAALLLNGVYADAHNLSLVPNAGPGGVGTVLNMGDFSPAELRKVLPGERAVVGVGNRWYFPTLQTQTLITFYDLFGVSIGKLSMLPTGALQMYDAQNGLLWRSDPVIVAQSWQHIEVAVNFSDAAGGGFLRVGVDSVTIYDNDAIQTLPVTVPPQNVCSQIVWGPMLGPRMRDLYIWDDTSALNNSGMQGDRQIVTTYATADALNDWVPSSGTHGWSLVDNVPPVDTDFISANAPDLISTFQMGDIDTDITNISAVMVVSRLWKSDAGLATVKLRVTSSGDTAEGSEKAVSTNKVFYSSIFQTDPHTGVKWTPLGVNSLTAGLKRIS